MNFKIIQNPILSNAIHSHYLYFLVFSCFWFQILKSKKNAREFGSHAFHKIGFYG